MYQQFDKNDFFYFEVQKGMCGLKQAVLLAYNQLVKNLAPHGYHLVKHTTGLWVHDQLSTCFTLVVYNLGIQYQVREQAQKLLDTLRKYYVVLVDWTGLQYCGLTLAWDYDQGIVDVLMLGYVQKAIEKYQYKPTQRRDTPHE